MSPRPRTATDADILAAATRAISRLGPARLTLADVAREVGLSPATLIQRFGTKRGLLLAVVERGAASVDSCFAEVRQRFPRRPVDALIAAATEMTRYTTSPEEMANHLAFLQIDLSDPDFHRLASESTERIIDGYRVLIEDALAAGELVRCNSASLARAIQAIVGGSLIGWAIARRGSAESFVRADLDVLLEPYRATPAHGERTHPKRRPKLARRR